MNPLNWFRNAKPAPPPDDDDLDLDLETTEVFIADTSELEAWTNLLGAWGNMSNAEPTGWKAGEFSDNEKQYREDILRMIRDGIARAADITYEI